MKGTPVTFCFLLFLHLICIIGVISSGSYSCPAPCTCMGPHVDCSNGQLVTLPRIPAWTRSLDLSNNPLATSTLDDLPYLALLTKIDVSSCQLLEISPQLLIAAAPDLRVIIAKNNRLTRLPALGDGRSNYETLDELNLSNNSISQLTYNDVANLRRVRRVDLSHNNLAHVDWSATPMDSWFERPATIQYLKLSRQRHSTADATTNNSASSMSLPNSAFAAFDSLVELDLSRMRIDKVQRNVFRQLKKLQVLNLSRNRLTSIDSIEFNDITRLRSLDISRNHITNPRDGVMWGLQQLQILNLANNQLVDVDKRWLYGLRALRKINLSSNKITTIAHDTWRFCSRLTHIDLSTNELTDLPNGVFAGLHVLGQLSLANNRIERIRGRTFADCCTRLVEFDLSNNLLQVLLEDASQSLFQHLTSLQALDLSDNVVRNVHTKLFNGLNKLQSLNLAGNPIRTVSKNGVDMLPKLVDVAFNTASLICDCRSAWLTEWTRGMRAMTMNPQMIIKCDEPPNLRGRLLSSLTKNEITCDEPTLQPTIIASPGDKLNTSTGNIVSLKCQATSARNDMVVEWRRDGEVIYVPIEDRMIVWNEVKRRNPFIIESTLTMSNVQMKDAGEYRCRVHNKFGSAFSSQSTLAVHVLPIITITPRNTSINVGGNAPLLCAAEGRPTPTIQWHKDDGQTFHAALERRFHTSPQDDTFYIANVTKYDSGWYTCVATNVAGSVSARAYLSVNADKRRFSDWDKSSDTSTSAFYEVQDESLVDASAVKSGRISEIVRMLGVKEQMLLLIGLIIGATIVITSLICIICFCCLRRKGKLGGNSKLNPNDTLIYSRPSYKSYDNSNRLCAMSIDSSRCVVMRTTPTNDILQRVPLNSTIRTSAYMSYSRTMPSATATGEPTETTPQLQRLFIDSKRVTDDISTQGTSIGQASSPSSSMEREANAGPELTNLGRHDRPNVHVGEEKIV